MGKGVTWSNFLEFVIIWLAKFWIDCSLLTFPADVIDHTVEQYNILLKTNDAISNFKVSLIKLFLTRFIWYSLEKQDETTCVMW